MASMSQLTMAMVTLYSGDPKRIQHFMLFADGKSTRDSRISGARECSSLDGTK